jgi:hypothetical protein
LCATDQHRMMCDPSLLLANPDLVRNSWSVPNLIVSRSFVRAVVEGQVERFAPFIPAVPPPPVYVEDPLATWRDAVMPNLREMATFSADDVEQPGDAVAATRERISQLSTPAAEILADEWVYLATQSWLGSKTRFAMDKLQESGAEVHEYSRRRLGTIQEAVGERTRLVGERLATVRARLAVELIKEVTGKTPPEPLTPRFIAKVGIKWIGYGGIVGGAAAGGFAAGGPAGAGGGAALGTVARPLVRLFDP